MRRRSSVCTTAWVALTPGELYGPALAEARASLETFARLCLPQIFFYGMYVLLGEVLNARNRFGPAMFAPIANNVVACLMLGSYLLLYEPGTGAGGYTRSQELLLGLGSTLGVVVQALVLVPYLRKVGLRYRPRFDFRGTGLSKTGRLAIWTLLLVIVNQVTYLVVTRMAVEGAALAEVGGLPASVGATVYQNAYLVIMLPHALITVSLATAVLPRLSRQAAAGSLGDLGRELVSTMKFALAGAVAAGFVLLALAMPVTRLLFGWGAAAGETRSLGITVMLFVPGLVGFTIHFTAMRGFYALEDTRTPFFIQCLVSVVTIGSALIISAVVGRPSAMVLAASFSIAFCVAALASTAALSRRTDSVHRAELVRFMVRMCAISAPAALAAYLGAWLGTVSGGVDGGGDHLAALLAVVVGGALSLPTFLVGARLLHVTEVDRIASMINLEASTATCLPDTPELIEHLTRTALSDATTSPRGSTVRGAKNGTSAQSLVTGSLDQPAGVLCGLVGPVGLGRPPTGRVLPWSQHH